MKSSAPHVIWSKYAEDRIADGEPSEDQPTEAELFKSTLLEAEPKFQHRLIFVELEKPKLLDRPSGDSWVAQLQQSIQLQLNNLPACALLWKWESLVHTSGIAIGDELATVVLGTTLTGGGSSGNSLEKGLSQLFRHIVKEQAEPGASPSAAPRHLASILGQSLADRIEHCPTLNDLAADGEWLSKVDGLGDSTEFGSKLNGMLLTSSVSPDAGAFVPGTVYRVTDTKEFESRFGVSVDDLALDCSKSFSAEARNNAESWKSKIVPILIELSPVCDVAQCTRRQALLVGGCLIPAQGKSSVSNGDAKMAVPVFSLRWPVNGEAESDVFAVFCSRYKLTVPHTLEPSWIQPWFRFREILTASIRSWHAGHASRVGYFSLK